MTADTLIAAALKRLGKVEVAWRRGAFVVTITTEAGTRSWSDISWSSLWMRVVMAALEAKLEGNAVKPDSWEEHHGRGVA
jgi:membrane protein required for beta-lactamase induction